MNKCSRLGRGFKNLRILLALLASTVCLSLVMPAATAGERPLRVLIFSGQNNHDWTVTTPKLQSILSKTGRFHVVVTDHPEECDASTFEGYDALLSNWNTFGQGGAKERPAKMREAFLQFVREGHGLVIVHAGGSSFPDWNEYQELIGGTWGPETGHGPLHRFEVRIAAPAHPITRGFPPFKTTDELWHRIASRPGKTVLATAFSASERGGSGRDEPVAFVTKFGQGRCFNLVLGHDAAAMSSAGFQALLGRGTEWAATGKITLPAPSAETAEDLDSLLHAAAVFQPTASRESRLELERVVAGSPISPSLRESLADKLAARLASDDRVEARKFFCSQLSLIGSAKQVPLIEPLLRDANLSYYARLVLERIPGDASLAALQRALANTSGPERVGIINSLAVRSDNRVVSDLTALARGNDTEAATAAIKAIGQIGEINAWGALSDLEPGTTDALEAELRRAQLHCAASLVSLGNQEDAIPVLEKLFTSGPPPALRAAAFNLWASVLGQAVAPRILAALTGPDVVLSQAAIQALENAEYPVLASAAQRLGSMAPRIEVSLLTILDGRRAAGTVPDVLRCLASKDALVRMAALAALGVLGDASTVPFLTSLLTTANPIERSAISDTLARLPGNGVEEVLLGRLDGSEPEVTLAIIKALRDRASVQAIPAFTKATADVSLDVRLAAIRALGQLAGGNSCALLIGLLDQASPQAVPEIESALAQICRRSADISPLVRALAESPSPRKLALLNILAAVGGPEALAPIRAELNSNDPELRLAALRLVAEWPNPDPLQTLGSIALTSPDTRCRILALRGLARMAPLARDEAATEVVEVIRRALLGAGLNEQRALLAALGEITNSASLKVAAANLTQPALVEEAKAAVYRILDSFDNSRRADVRPVLDQLKSSCTNATEAARLEWLAVKFGDLQNLSLEATATSLDGLTADGQGGTPSAAIDGNEKTYWDEVDNEKLYILRVDFKELSKIAFVRIVAFQQHSYAPRDFEILSDGKLLKKVEAAQYLNNSFRVDLPETLSRGVVLRITSSYGPSPAIRELEIYGKPADH